MITELEETLAEVSIGFSAWEDHAGWWQQEAERARERMNVDDDTIAQARQAFGKIGSSTVGAAYASALEARRAAGYRLGGYAESVAAHIRRDLQTYAEGEADSARTLNT